MGTLETNSKVCRDSGVISVSYCGKTICANSNRDGLIDRFSSFLLGLIHFLKFLDFI